MLKSFESKFCNNILNEKSELSNKYCSHKDKGGLTSNSYDMFSNSNPHKETVTIKHKTTTNTDNTCQILLSVDIKDKSSCKNVK